MRSTSQPRQPLDPTRRSLESQEFDAALRQKIVGQEEAVRALVDLYQVFCADMCPAGRPIGNLLFLGPTGSGKTRIVEATAEILLGDVTGLSKATLIQTDVNHGVETIAVQGAAAMLDGQVDG